MTETENGSPSLVVLYFRLALTGHSLNTVGGRLPAVGRCCAAAGQCATHRSYRQSHTPGALGLDCFLPLGVFFVVVQMFTRQLIRDPSPTTSYFHRPEATPPTTIPRSVFQSLKRQVIFGFGGKLLLRKQTAARCPQQLQREPPSDHSQGASAAAQKKSSTVMGRNARGATMPSHFHMQGAFILSFIN